MELTARCKPIRAYAEVTEEKYVREIIQSLSRKPSESCIKKNQECLNLLRKARRG